MTISLDIEETLENAYIAVLQANAYIIANSIPVRRWKDANNKKTYPVVVVHCDNVGTEPTFRNVFLATPALINIGVMTYKTADKDAAVVNTLRNQVRSTLSSATLVTELNAEEAGLNVYDNAIFWGSPVTDEDTSTVRRRDINQEVTATVVDVP